MTFLRCSKMYFAFCEYWLSEIRTWVWCVSAKRVYHCATWSSGGSPLRPSGGECSVLGEVHGAHNFACTRPEVHWGSTLGPMHTSQNSIPSAHGFITHLGGGVVVRISRPFADSLRRSYFGSWWDLNPGLVRVVQKVVPLHQEFASEVINIVYYVVCVTGVCGVFII